MTSIFNKIPMDKIREIAIILNSNITPTFFLALVILVLGN
jgi:hypothetical protein